jgi:hypothetical protein
VFVYNAFPEENPHKRTSSTGANGNSLYGDGLDVRDDTESYAGTDGDAPKGIKG